MIRADDKKYLYDSGWMSGAITQSTVPLGFLEYNRLYRVRVVYKDSQGKLSSIKYSYFKVEKAPKPKIKSIEIPNIGQTGAFVIAKVDTHNEDGIKAYIEWSSNDTNTWQSKPIAIKKDQDIFYHKLNNLQCNTTYTYRAYVENNRSGKDYTPFKTFKTLPCAPLVKIATKSDTTGLVSFGNVAINKCASKIVTVIKMNDIGVAHGKVGFSDLSGNDTNEFYIIDGEYTLHNKGDKKDIEVEYCPNKEAEHSLLLTANDGKYTMEKYSQGLLITGEAVDKGNTTFSGDFYLTNASLSKTTVKVGETFKAHVTQHYSGNINKSQKVYLGYFLSKDKIWDKDDDPLDYDYSSLDKNDIENEEGETLKITEKGDYYILFVSDYRKKYNETDESNNVKYIKIKVESPSAIDTDNDGITDTDEAKYGLNPNNPSDATQDNDGDGVSNIDEITAGTDPTDANSHPNKTKTKITLKKGWNLFGANTLISLQSFKADIGIDNLLILQGSSKTYKKEYIDNGTNFLDDFTKMEIGKGYWVKLALDAEFEYSPIAIENTTIELNSGWNLINPTKELTISEIKSQIGADNLLIIQGENKTYKKEYVDDGTEFLNDFNKFEEPKGYWIKLQNSSRLTQ